jgi:hypothetical protein
VSVLGYFNNNFENFLSSGETYFLSLIGDKESLCHSVFYIEIDLLILFIISYLY